MMSSSERSQAMVQQLELDHFWLAMAQVQPVLGNSTVSDAVWAPQVDDLHLAVAGGGEL